MYLIQMAIVVWAIKTFIKYTGLFKPWFLILVFSVFGFTLIQLILRFKEASSLKDLEKEENK